MKKLYYVKREVLANSITEAARKAGRIYEISLAAASEQPNKETKVKGFTKTI